MEKKFGKGWIPDLPDFRDYSQEAPALEPLLKKIGLNKKNLAKPPAKVDLRPRCSPIENQGGLGSCTAHAAAGLEEYFERKAFGEHLDASSLFVYKPSR